MRIRPLSAGALAVFAKTRPALRRKPDQQPKPEDEQWLPLHVHSSDIAGVAAHLLDEWVPETLLAQQAALCDVGVEQFRATCIFLAAMHDLGKATPAFAVYDPKLLAELHPYGMDCQVDAGSAVRIEHGHHTITGYFILRQLLAERGWSHAAAREWAQVVGAHHGAPLHASQLDATGPQTHPDLYGNERWDQVRRELFNRWLAECAPSAHRIPGPVAFWLSGLIIHADWIASSTADFPHHGFSDRARVDDGIARHGLPKPWRPAQPVEDPVEHLRSRFPHIDSLYPAQTAAIQAAHTMTAPGVLLIEAPMGDGKTEAALTAAEVLAAKFGAGGLVLALPTRATSDAMFARTLDWSRHLPPGSIDKASIVLGHGKAKLNHDYTALPDHAAAHPDGPVTYRWMAGSQRRLLSSFAVVTIDQLLVAVIRHKHQALRHLGLAGKVVVIDEVHAYDQWMSNHLDLLLGWLAHYKVPVILLSATLPPSRRSSLLAAYTGQDNDLHTDTSYPLIVAAEPGRPVQVSAPESSARHLPVSVELIGENPNRLVSAVDDAIRAGANVLIVRNTVRRAQQLYDVLRRRFDPATVSLHHSRFLAADRALNDKQLLNQFGPPERMARKGYVRPVGRIVVATQVAEQSLDVDFDLLITDLAPTDLLLQRMGRLQRFNLDRPHGFGRARCLISGVRFAADGPVFEPWPYRALPMLSAALLVSQCTTVTLPDDIPVLVRDAYDPDLEFPPSWEAKVVMAHRERDDDEADAEVAKTWHLAPGDMGPLFGISKVMNGGARTEMQAMRWARNSEDSVEAVVLVSDANGELYVPGWIRHPLAGQPVPRRAGLPADLVDAVLRCTVPLPGQLCGEDTVKEMLNARPAAWSRTPLDVPLIILDRPTRIGTLAGWTLNYDPATGLSHTKVPKKP